jgi:NTE family protein
MRTRMFKTALVLSGGGSRALAHLGALDEFLKRNMQIDLVVGASMGAIIGGLYAYYGDVLTASAKIREFLESELFVYHFSKATDNTLETASESLIDRYVGWFKKGIYYTHSIVKSALVSEETYLEVMSHLIPSHPMEKLNLPFAAVAMDIATGEEIVLRTGCLRKAVSASLAIPGILPPVQYDGRLLVDGGWADNVPSAPAIAMGAHFVIGVDASTQLHELGPMPASALDLLHRSNDITRILLNRERRKCADVLLTPEIGYLHWADFTYVDHCIRAGKRVVSKNLWHIRMKALKRRAHSLGGWIHPARKPSCRRPMVFY